MTLAARVRRQLDRPLTEHERRVASVLLAMVLAAASAALVLTHPPSTATRSREHHGSAPASAQAPTGSVAVVPRAVTGTVDGFLVGYLRYLYGRGSASRVENATASFSRSLEQHPNGVAISATTGEGVPALLAELGSQLRPIREFMELSVPHEQSGVIARLHEVAQVVERDYNGKTARFKARIPPHLHEEFAPFVVRELQIA